MKKVGCLAVATLLAHSLSACSRAEPSFYPIAICPGSGLRTSSTFDKANEASREFLPPAGGASSGQGASASREVAYFAEYHSGDVGPVLGFAIETTNGAHRLIVRISSRGADQYAATWTWQRTIALSSGAFAELSALFEAPSLWNEPIDTRIYGAGAARLSWSSQGNSVQKRDFNGYTASSRTLREALVKYSRCH